MNAQMARRWRRAGIALATVGVVAASVYALGPGEVAASSHREAPLVAADPAIDNTDVYAFASPDRPGYVTLISNWIPFEEPNGGPNFYPFATDARYNIFIDNNGDGKPDVTLRWTFKNIDKRGNNTFLYNNGPVTSIDDPHLLFRQTYTLESSFNGGPFITRIKDAPVAPSRVGPASMPDYQTLRDQATVTFPGGWKGFAGQADDPFFIDLRIFDLLYGGNLSEVGQDTLAGYNVNSIALQLPATDLALNGDATRNPVIGVWSTTERQRVRITGGASYGDWVQVSRLGNPLVNEVIVPTGLKDTFNATRPDQDASVPGLVQRVLDPEVPKLIQSIYGVPAPAAPRNDLKEIFLTGITTKAGGPIKADLNSQLNNADVNPDRFRPSEMLRLNMSTPVSAQPNRLGVLGGDLQGFPNGRRLTDDVVDIELQALEGAAQTGQIVPALAAGDKVDHNDDPFGASFPYLALPNTEAVNQHLTGGSGAASGGTSGNAETPSSSPSPDAVQGNDHATAMTTMALSAGGATVLAGGMFFGLWWRRRHRSSSTVDDHHI
jgi:hypothetical protein